MGNKFEMKIWGWGAPTTRFDLQAHPGVVRYMKSQFGLEELKTASHIQVDEFALRPSRMDTTILNAFNEALGTMHCTTVQRDRVLHSFGKSYKDLIRLRAGEIDSPPDVVLYPQNVKHLQAIFQIAATHNVALIPFGGGTSVVSGVESFAEAHPYCASVDLRQLNRILEIDENSLLVSAEAGIFGPDLEEALNARGLTLGHFPQSFEFSTLGGWLAARGAGQNSNRYGTADKMLISLAAETPRGPLRTKTVAHKSCGPEIKHLLLGSEGVYGIIHRATLRVRPLPAKQEYFAVLFKSFSCALEVSRRIVQNDIPTAMIRVSDEEETRSLMALSTEKTGVSKWISRIAKAVARKRGFVPPHLSIMMIGLEGSAEEVGFSRRRLKSIFNTSECMHLGTTPGKNWLKSRYFMPYLRDEFMDNGMFVDTLETATTWSNIDQLYVHTRSAIETTCKAQGVRHAIYTHISHVYSTGASLYFTIIAEQASTILKAQLEQWEEIKTAASEAITKHTGVISHHHGVGMDHRPFLEVGQGEGALLRAIKEHLDPQNLLNPGKLLTDLPHERTT